MALGRNAVLFAEPSIQVLDTALSVDGGLPPNGVAEFASVRNVIALVSDPPFVSPDVRFRAGKLGDHIDEVDQADRIVDAAANVERLPGELRGAILGSEHGAYQVIDIEDVPHLAAVA